MQPARDFPSNGEGDVVGGGFRVSNFPSPTAYNRHISYQPARQRSTEHLDPRLLTSLARQRVAGRANSYAQYGPYVYQEILPRERAQQSIPGRPVAPAAAMRSSMSYRPAGAHQGYARESTTASGGPPPAARASYPPPGTAATAAAMAAHQQAAEAAMVAAAAAAAAGLPYLPTGIAATMPVMTVDPRVAVQGHMTTSVYASGSLSPPPPQHPQMQTRPQPQAQQPGQQAPAEHSAATAPAEAPDSPLRGFVRSRSHISAAAAGAVAAAEAWLAATAGDPAFADAAAAAGGPPEGAERGSSGHLEPSQEITLSPHELAAATADANAEAAAAEEASQLPPTPNAATAALRISAADQSFARASHSASQPEAVAGTASSGPQFDASAQQQQQTVGSGAAPVLRVVPPPGRALGESFQGPLPGGSSPRLPDGSRPPPATGGPDTTVVFSSVEQPHRRPPRPPAQYPGQRPSSAAAAVPPGADPRAMLLREAGRAPGQSYGATGAGTAAGAPAGPPQQQWESSAPLEVNSAYTRYSNQMAKGEFGGGVPHPDYTRGSQAMTPSWRTYLMRSRGGAVAPSPRASGSAPGGWGRVGASASVRHSTASMPSESSAQRASAAAAAVAAAAAAASGAPAAVGAGQAGGQAVRPGSAVGASQQGFDRRARDELWRARAYLAADARSMRTAARLLRAENRRLSGEAAALATSMEGYERGWLGPSFVRLHADAVDRRLGYSEEYGNLLAGSAAEPRRMRDIEPYATAAEAAAAEAAAGPTGGPPARPGSAPPLATDPAAATSGAGASTQQQTGPQSAEGGDRFAYQGGDGYDRLYDRALYGSATAGLRSSQSRFQFVAPAELRLRRDVAAEAQLRGRLGTALSQSYERLSHPHPQRQQQQQLEPTNVPPDPDVLLELIQLARQRQEEQQQGYRQDDQQQQQPQQQQEGQPPPAVQREHQPTGPEEQQDGQQPDGPPPRRRVHFSSSVAGGAETTMGGGTGSLDGSITLRPERLTGKEAAAAAAAALEAAEAAAIVAKMGRSGGDGAQAAAGTQGGGAQEGQGQPDQDAEQEPEEDPGLEGERRVANLVERLLIARAAADLISPRPPAPDPPPPLSWLEGGEDPPDVPLLEAALTSGASPALVRAYAILAAMGGRKLDFRELQYDPRVGTLEHLLGPPASSLLALLYLSCRQSVPHPDDLLAAADQEFVTRAAAMGRAAQGLSPEAEDGAAGAPGPGFLSPSPLSRRPPAGDLFMDYGSPYRAPYGQSYHHIKCWSVRDSGLVLERQAREMQLGGRQRVPRAYLEVDKALRVALNVDEPDLEDRADELRERIQQEAYEQKVRQAGEELRDAERESYGYIKSAPMEGEGSGREAAGHVEEEGGDEEGGHEEEVAAED